MEHARQSGAQTDPAAVRILIAASGTGGHLLPARYIAQALSRMVPESEIHFVGSGRPLEQELIDAHGFTRHVIRTVGVKSRGLKGLLQFALTLPGAFIATWKLISGFRPHVVIGVGGYVSVLPVIVAALRGIPTWIHEAERSPGLATRAVCRFASRISVAFDDAHIPSGGKRVVFTGHPVRPELSEIKAAPKDPSEIRHLLVLGGSQGARALDTNLPELCALLKARGLSVIHQARPENLAMLKERYSAAGVQSQVVPFVEDLPQAYRWADLIISRAGAGSVMELGAVNIPVILVPYPHAQGNHQLINAKTLADVGKAMIVEEGPEFAVRLEAALSELLTPERYSAMYHTPFVSRALDAADQIARGALELAAR